MAAGQHSEPAQTTVSQFEAPSFLKSMNGIQEVRMKLALLSTSDIIQHPPIAPDPIGDYFINSCLSLINWWEMQVSNLRPLQCECSALPLS